MNLDPVAVRRALERHLPQRIEVGNLQPAAVLLPLYVRDGEDHVLFTRRTEGMNHHAGEISFPGGRWQQDDADLLATALRETGEEVGIAPRDVEVLGTLDDIISVHGYHVTPYVGLFPWPYPLQVDPREIAEVIEIPLDQLRDPAIFHEEDWQHRGRIYPVPFFIVDRHTVWGLTAAILRQFLQRVFGSHV